jgi:hypothetical protein
MYAKTITITKNMLAKIESGDIKIKSGQWIQYAWLDKKSRFVGVTNSRSVWAVHSRYGKYNTQSQSIKKFQ